MVKLPKNWKDIKQQALDPDKREEFVEKAQHGMEVGRTELGKRLKGPAAHLRKVGSQFKAGLGSDDEPAATAPAATAEPAASPAPPASAPPAADADTAGPAPKPEA